MDVLREAARRSPRAAAVRGAERAGPGVTYAELDLDADRLARWLSARTVEGAVVAMRLPQCREALALLHGAWRAGRVLAPLGSGWTDREIDEALEAVGSPAVVVDDPTPLTRVLGGMEPEPGALPTEPDPDRIRVLICTSGTSGRPRPIAITERNLAASAGAARSRLSAGPDDCWLGVLSLAHIGGFVLAHRAAVLGASVLTLERFDAEQVGALVDAGAISHASLVPTMLSRLMEVRGERPAPDSLRGLLIGGAACPPTVLERAIALRYPVALTYGLTEATSQVATATPEEVRRKPGTVGRPLPGVELRIDVGDSELEPALEESEPAPALGDSELEPALEDSESEPAVGEIVLRGPTVCEQSLADDGWLHTGDLGYVDEDGDLWLVGRSSDAIVTGGVTVHPAEIEAVLGSHPAVAEVAVAGVPDPEWGELVQAVVVPHSLGAPPTLEDLLQFSRARLSAAKRPRALRIVAALPRNANGKVDRARIAAPEAES